MGLKEILSKHIVYSKMEKIDLTKLSKSELLALIADAQTLVEKQVKQSVPEPKPVKIKPSKKLSEILTEAGKVITYPKKLVSIAQMRDEEFNMAFYPGKSKLSFAELFERRIRKIPGRKARVRIKIEAEVRYSFGIQSEIETKHWGPFEDIIRKLSKDDMYKMFIYLLQKKGFSILSTQTIEEVGATIITHKKSFFQTSQNGSIKIGIILSR